MKKIICFILSVAMMFSISFTAFAAEDTPEIDVDVAATIAMMYESDSRYVNYNSVSLSYITKVV